MKVNGLKRQKKKKEEEKKTFGGKLESEWAENPETRKTLGKNTKPEKVNGLKSQKLERRWGKT